MAEILNRKGKTYRIDVTGAGEDFDINPRTLIIRDSVEFFPQGVIQVIFGGSKLVSKETPILFRIREKVIEWIDTDAKSGEKGYELKFDSQEGDLFKGLTVTDERILPDGQIRKGQRGRRQGHHQRYRLGDGVSSSPDRENPAGTGLSAWLWYSPIGKKTNRDWAERGHIIPIPVPRMGHSKHDFKEQLRWPKAVVKLVPLYWSNIPCRTAYFPEGQGTRTVIPIRKDKRE